MNSETQHGPTPRKLLEMTWNFAGPLVVAAAVEHRVFDVLDPGPKSAEEIARDTAASVRGVRMIANALVPLGLLTKDPEGRYALAPESKAFLVRGRPGYHGGYFRYINRELLPAWLGLGDNVKTGRPAPSRRSSPEMFEQLVADLFPLVFPGADALGRALNLGGARGPVRVLDLAAGSGVWGIALARQSPHVTVTAVDYAEVLPVTRKFAARFEVEQRLHTVAGDLFTVDLGEGYKVVTLGHILHTQGEGQNRLMLKRAFDALAPGGTVAIGEFVADDERTGPASALNFALNMLVYTEQGDTYTLKEITGWLTDAGFVDVRTIDAPAPSPLIVATKP